MSATKIVLPSAARTANTDSPDLQNPYARGVQLIVDVTAIVTTPSITVTIQGKDPASGKYYAILTSAAITSTGTTVLTVYPGLTGQANVKEDNAIPLDFRVSVAHANANSITYSIGANMLK